MDLFTINMKLNLSWKEGYFFRVDNQNKLVSKQEKSELVICVVLKTVLLQRRFHHPVHSIQTIKKSMYRLFVQNEISNENKLDWKILASTFSFNYQQTIFFINVIYVVEATAGTMPTVFHIIRLHYGVNLTFM